MAVSVLFRIDENGHVEVLDSGPAPAVVVDSDGQLHAASGTITYAGEDLDGEPLALAALKHPGLPNSPRNLSSGGLVRCRRRWA